MCLKQFVRGLWLYGLSTVFLLFTLFPIYWLLNSALKPPNQLFTFPPQYWPDSPTLQNFADALTQTRLGRLYVNSLVISALTCVILLILIIFAAYSMARFRFRGKSIILVMFLLAQMLPAVVLLLPFYVIFSSLDLANSPWSLIITYTITNLPFCVLMMQSFYETIPVELDEAAMVDGCGRIEALLKVVLPAALPGLVATSIFGFINSWNELIYAVVFVSSSQLQTLPVGLRSMMDENRQEYGMLLAVAFLALVPSLILFGYIQRFLTTGLVSGAVKG
ncbi:MAG: carbohydrate ABC transporter permease [Chloroflexi bacterium]|nr:carbohydrate ABC transporter permease [Chloroflexota bacterium]